MWQLLIPLALWLGTAHFGRAELTAAQHQGLQVALEEFHKHPRVQWAFQETSVDSATEKLFPAGTFVRLEFKLQQTSCQKKDWKKAECRVKAHGTFMPGPLRSNQILQMQVNITDDSSASGGSQSLPGATIPTAGSPQLPPSWSRIPPLTPCPPPQRKRKCLACIKLDSKDKVLGRMVHCPIETQVQLELEEHLEAQCSRVERASEDPRSYYFPGQFAFSRALPPS
ncbi:hypothetical protein HPG69_016347 [Diceros bicornis minor]|uniref:Retinoic acid receptor responder protein 2 n=1 Tax=Diceros bicornis minor TaxID=77932 RepID=A0A7J7ETQ6_DICBM|nr:hypothetical protein HPG69_016347 [Diceros bicornis minor]